MIEQLKVGAASLHRWYLDQQLTIAVKDANEAYEQA